MGLPVKGDVVIVRFPFSDLRGSKRRPALVLARAGGRDIVLCPITTRTVEDPWAVPLGATDFTEGSLRGTSSVRSNCLLTADTSLVLYKAGRVGEARLRDVGDRIKALLDAP